MKKLSFSKNEHNKKEFHDEKILMKVRVAQHENNFFVHKVLWKFLLKQFVRVLKKSKAKESHSARDKKYS